MLLWEVVVLVFLGLQAPRGLCFRVLLRHVPNVYGVLI